MREVSDKSKPRFQTTELDRCLVCEKPLLLDDVKPLFAPIDVYVARLCRHCHSIYSTDDEVLELGKFGSTHVGIS